MLQGLYSPAIRKQSRSKALHAYVTQASPGQQKQRDLQAEPLRFTTRRMQCNLQPKEETSQHSTEIKSRYPGSAVLGRVLNAIVGKISYLKISKVKHKRRQLKRGSPVAL